VSSSVQTRRRAVVARTQGAGASCARPLACALPRACVVSALLVLVAACTDPRARPVPPSVEITLAPNLVVASPGTLYGTLHVFDETGLDSIRVTLDLGNGATVGDSTFFASDDPFEASFDLLWRLPPGLPRHTFVRFVARARSYIGFSAADTLLTAVGDTIR